MPRRKAKYKKTKIESWRCNGCEFEWCYRTIKCPICSGNDMIRTA